MPVKKKNNKKLTASRVIRSFIIVAVIAVMMGISAKLAMNSLNKKMGIEGGNSVTTTDSTIIEEITEEVVMPEFNTAAAMEAGSSAWSPDWKSTPCSIFVTEGSDAILDSLQEAPTVEFRNTELQLLIELWASYSDYEPMEIERVWVFASGDTCFVDLPRQADWQGIANTIENRFISYTVLLPFVAGEIVEGFEEGISIEGVPTR